MKAFVSWVDTRKYYSVRAVDGPDAGRVILQVRRLIMHDVEFDTNYTQREQRGSGRGVVGMVDVVDIVHQRRDICVTPFDTHIPATWHSIVDVEQVEPMIRDGMAVAFHDDKNRYIQSNGLEFGEITKADKVFLSPSMIVALNNGEKS